MQTEKQCIDAIKKNKHSFIYVINQTKNICMEILKIDGTFLKYVKDQDEEICLQALKTNIRSYEYIKDKSLASYHKYYHEYLKYNMDRENRRHYNSNL